MQQRRKTTMRVLQDMKRTSTRIAALGVYDAPMAAIADEIGFELFVIGNSGPMSLFGYKNAVQVASEDLRFMTLAVSRVTRYAMVVSTMPYMSYAISREEGVRTAARLVSEAGAECVQCHGTRDSVDNIRAIVRAGVPVLAHLGLQSVRKTEQSGYGVRGKRAEEAFSIVQDALALADAGVFAFTMELVPVQVTRYLRERLDVPVLSLGSGPFADGIYQVSADVVGFSVFRRPNSSAQFCDGNAVARQGIESFIEAARARHYPQANVGAHMSPQDAERLGSLSPRT